MLMPNRHGSTDDYRYGFQGQEKDDEIKGEGNSINFKYRMHDPRVGRFFAVDPLAKKYPYYSPYSFGGNTPIMAAELEGLEVGKPNYERLKNWLQEKKDAGSWGAAFGLSVLKNATLEGVTDQVKEVVVTVVNNPPPPKPIEEALFFPAFEFYHMGEQVVDTADRAIDGDGEAFGDLLFDLGGTFLGITEFKAAINAAKVETKALQSQLKQVSKTLEDVSVNKGYRTEPKDINEKLALEEAKAGAGEKIMANRLNDPKYHPETGTHDKISHNHNHGDGTSTEIHYDRNRSTGERSGFKIKDDTNANSRGVKDPEIFHITIKDN